MNSAYRYRRFNPLLRWSGKVLDALPLPFSNPTPAKMPPPTGSRILVFESHLIGDSVMTLALLNSLKSLRPDLKILLLANPWMETLTPEGLVQEARYHAVPWIIKKNRLQAWLHFLETARALRRERLPLIGIETRGDWRNALFLRLIGCQTVVAPLFTGGKRLISHPMPALTEDSPLFQTRQAALAALGLSSKLKMPPLPPLTDSELSEIAAIIPTNEPFTVLHPGASHPARHMGIETLETCLALLPKDLRTRPILVFHGPAEQTLAKSIMEQLIARGHRTSQHQTSLRQFAHVCASAAHVFAMDSGPAHLAAWANSEVTVFCHHDRPDIIKPFTDCLRDSDVKVLGPREIRN